jgi:hypothetical protein
MIKPSLEELIKLQTKFVFTTNNDPDIVLINKQLLGDIELKIQLEYENDELAVVQAHLNINEDSDGEEEILITTDCDIYSSYEDLFSEIIKNATEKSKKYNWLINQIDSLLDKCEEKNLNYQIIKSIIENKLYNL